MDRLSPELIHMITEYLSNNIWGIFRSVNSLTFELPFRADIRQRMVIQLQTDIKQSDFIDQINWQLARNSDIKLRCCALCATGELVDCHHYCNFCNQLICTKCCDRIYQIYFEVFEDKFRNVFTLDRFQIDDSQSLNDFCKVNGIIWCYVCAEIIKEESLKEIDKERIVSRFNEMNYQSIKLCSLCWGLNSNCVISSCVEDSNWICQECTPVSEHYWGIMEPFLVHTIMMIFA